MCHASDSRAHLPAPTADAETRGRSRFGRRSRCRRRGVASLRKEGTMTTPPRTYPPGVPSWIDTERADPRATAEFYSAVLGWTFDEESARDGYLIATLE